MLHEEMECVWRGLELHLTRSPGSLDRFSASCFPPHPTFFYSGLVTKTHRAFHYPPCPVITATLLPCQATAGMDVGRSDQDLATRFCYPTASQGSKWPQPSPPCSGTSSVHLASNRAGMSLVPLLHAGTFPVSEVVLQYPWGSPVHHELGHEALEKGSCPGLVSAWRLPSNWLEGKLAEKKRLCILVPLTFFLLRFQPGAPGLHFALGYANDVAGSVC